MFAETTHSLRVGSLRHSIEFLIYLVLLRSLKRLLFEFLIGLRAHKFKLGFKSQIEVLGQEPLKKISSSFFVDSLVILVSVLFEMIKRLFDKGGAPVCKALQHALIAFLSQL